MPDLLAEIWSLEGLSWLIVAAFLAGMVRGFSGFGNGLIYIPIAAQFVSPVWAVMTMGLMDIAGPAPMLAKVWKDRHQRDLLRLFVGTIIGLPIGLALLVAVDPNVFRYSVSILSLMVLAILLAGLRYRGEVRPPMLFGIGAASGFLGGTAGIPGPPVILFYMASPHQPAVIRANTTLYLLGYDTLLIGFLAIQSMLSVVPVLLGILLTIPNMVGNMIGAAVFHPDYEKTYRAVAYLLIACAAISSLPFWG
ncbi:hypothetical protein SAMN05444000_103145 [Shimia gijangensis]|uniref:Probable membrane transporter protein n=1 Tax=Shimia gijangensis TaxID=1470563 RepID=A0A1M6E901_9RHOB|nr:sulfite exporter TauE/SafE family protein [Shimia gijangensis]SHI81925.1 hypothetical protein SAMN05444000_103145 [Shimia gijangensis]